MSAEFNILKTEQRPNSCLLIDYMQPLRDGDMEHQTRKAIMYLATRLSATSEA